jgi:dienelactone hydrolase
MGKKTTFRPWSAEIQHSIMFIIILLSLCAIQALPAAENMTQIPLVLKIPRMDQVQVTNNVVYKKAGGEKLVADIYYPPALKPGERIPVVVFVIGYTNNAFSVQLKNWRIYTDWARLAAVSGFAGVLYNTTAPAADILDLLSYLRQNAASLKIDENRIALWACSANALTALTVLAGERKEFIKGAVLYYGLTLTPDQKFRDTISVLNKKVNFSMAGVDAIKNWHRDLPYFIVRAGRDMREFNQALDHFIAVALANNVPLTLINYTAGRHAFDTDDDNERSREIIRATIEFLKLNLLPYKEGK